MMFKCRKAFEVCGACQFVHGKCQGHTTRRQGISQHIWGDEGYIPEHGKDGVLPEHRAPRWTPDKGPAWRVAVRL
jgi:hypothetical protein